MTGQLAFDLTLPAQPGAIRQHAVVFTALGGAREGQQTYYTTDMETMLAQRDWLHQQARNKGRTPDARIMVRTVTCGEWEEVQ